MKRVLIMAPLCLLLLPCATEAKEWARKMFETTYHDFETVARGGTAQFDFVLQNIYKEDIHISDVRSSCGCTSPEIVVPLLKTWQKGAIRCKFNTRSFLGEKKATITVMIDKPFVAEVQLTVRGYIRQDVVLYPGALEFGEVEGGDSVERRIKVSYAGRQDWAIVNVERPSDHYDVRLRETRRAEGRVDYEMLVRLTENAPAGFLTDQFLIVTNDTNLSKIPFTVNGKVLPGITVSPASLQLGVLDPGQRVTKQLVVRSKRPFQITDVHCDGDCLTFKSPAGAKSLHLVPVTFTAGDSPGNLAMNIHIKTDLGDGVTATCRATATVR